MKKLSFSVSLPNGMASLPAANIFWKNARREILEEYFQDLESTQSSKIIFKLSEEQIKKIRSSRHVPDDLRGRIFKICQQQKDIVGLLVNIAAKVLFARLDKICETGHPWEIMLALNALSHVSGISCEWMDDEKVIQDILDEADSATIEKCAIALEYMGKFMDIKCFAQDSFPLFLKNYSDAAKKASLDEVQDIDAFIKYQKSLLQLQKIKKEFVRGILVLRKSILDIPERKKIFAEVTEDADGGNVWAFAQAINKYADDLLERYRECVINALPKPLDMELLRDVLRNVVPAMPITDLDIALAELDDIENGNLEKIQSQLLNNIIPAMLGEKQFAVEEFEEAADKGEARPYSYKFIRKLTGGAYTANIAGSNESANSSNEEQDNNQPEYVDPPQTMTVFQAVELARAIDEEPEEMPAPEMAGEIAFQEVDLVEPDTVEDASSRDETPAIEEQEAILETGEEKHPLEDAVVEVNPDELPFAEASEDEAEKSENSINKKDSDPFERYENMFDHVLPDNDEEETLPERDYQVKDRVEDRDVELTAVEQSIKDPLERKFAVRQRRQNLEAGNQEQSLSSAGIGKNADQSSSVKAAEKKSSIEASGSFVKKDDNAGSDFAAFIKALGEQPRAVVGKIPENSDWNLVFRKILEAGELAGLIWLARVLEDKAPLPAWLLELLYLGGQLILREETSNARILELSAQATEKLDELTEGQILLLAAAILRPILMMPDKNMATIASFLSSRLGNYALTPFFRSLEGFIQRGQPVEASIFTGESQELILDRRHEKLRQMTKDYLYRILHAKLPYQPASQLRNILFKESGYIGGILTKCLKGDFLDLDDFMQTCADDRSIEKLIDDTTQRFPNFTKHIQAKARKSLISDIRQAAQIAQNWREYITSCENAKGGGYTVKAFYDLFANVPEDMSRLKKSVEGSILENQISCLKACERNRLPAPAFDTEMELRIWPARSRNLLKEQNHLPESLAYEILSGDIADDNYVAGSIVFHIARGKLEACSAFLNKHDAIAKTEPDPDDFSGAGFYAKGNTVLDFMEMGHKFWADRFLDEYDKVKKRIAECEFRGALHTHETAKFLDELDIVRNKYGESGDKAAGVDEFAQILQKLAKREKEWDEQIRKSIDELRERRDLSAEAAQRIDSMLVPHLESGMYNLAWADIVEIQDHLATGEPFAEKSIENPDSVNGAHDFYRQLEAESITVDNGQLLPQWAVASREIKNRVYPGGMEARAKGIITEFVRHLGFNLGKDDQPEIIHTTGKPNNWRVMRFKMDIEGPLPQWSKRIKRHIVAFGWNVTPENINQLLSVDKMDNEDCKTIICFNPLDMAARKRIMSMCANRGVAPLVIDENLSAFLATKDEAEWKDILFRICFAGTSLIPYTDVGGAVPAEMFFGRENDIRALSDKHGPCIMYGGRQLGKSAILLRIFNSHKEGLKTLWHSMDNSESSLMEAIRRECVKEGIVDDRATLKSLPDNIKKWLDANQDSRILALLDECDRALDNDMRNSFVETFRLRDLMAETGRRFKVVLTGLHSVQRFSQINNQPFLHFGEPLCIGPLSPDAAHDLMVKPMSLLGLEFASEQLVQIALNHCGYQPKLIQIFCMELLKAIGQARNVPFHTIDSDRIQKIYASNNLKKKIVECFDMTLNLDDRYLVIGYVLAIYSGNRLCLENLLDELIASWPAAFNPELNGLNRGDMLNTLKSLLHEMEGLGLVTSLDNEYRLRTPGVIDLLGGLDNIYSRLDPYESRPYMPEASQDKLRVDEHGVFVASQYNLLAEKNNLFCWISGNEALGIGHVPEILAKIAGDMKFEMKTLSGATPHDMFQTMRDHYANLDKGGLLCLVKGDEFPFMQAFMEQACQWFGSLRTGRKFIKIICVIDPDTMHDFVRTGFAQKFSASHMQLLPWSQEGIEIYIRDKGIPGRDADKIYNETRGWTKLVKNYFNSGEKNHSTLSLADLWGTQSANLARLAASQSDWDGLLRSSKLEEDAAYIFDELKETGLANALAFANWLETLRSLFILRESKDYLYLDQAASAAISGGAI